jgi:hypothetical protein
VAEKEDEEVVQRVLLLQDTLQGYQDLLMRSACITAEITRSQDTLDCVETKVFAFTYISHKFLDAFSKNLYKIFLKLFEIS